MSNFIVPAYAKVTYTMVEVMTALLKAGFPAEQIETMTAIAGAESSWTNAIQENQPYSTTGWGTWQITPGNSVPDVGVDMALLDLSTNARAAYTKYSYQGLKAWSTYNNGVYGHYYKYIDPDTLSQAQALAVAASQASIITTTAHPVTMVKDYNHGPSCQCGTCLNG